MTGGTPPGDGIIRPSDAGEEIHPASIADAADNFAARVRAAAAAAKIRAGEQAARLTQEAKDHPAETVTGAFGLGYLVGKALFKRRRE